MANTGLLVLTNPTRVTKLAPVIRKCIRKTLYIQYVPDKLDGNLSENYRTESRFRQHTLPISAQIVSNIYTSASTVLSCLDIRVLLHNLKNTKTLITNTKSPIDLVIFDNACSKETADLFVKNCVGNKTTNCNFLLYKDEQNGDEPVAINNCVQDMKAYKNVVLGGTFDRLHNGHKIFLSSAVLHCIEKLTVGVTDVNMISGKLLWELIEPCSTRMLNVKNFLEDVDASLSYEVVPIHDMYGPTKDDPILDLIVVSEETKKGADKVNNLRAQNKLSTLDIHVVQLALDHAHDVNEESKISSSNHRMRLLGTRLQMPKIDQKPLKPYIIGLTGGIASGKSSVAHKLQSLGAGLVNCDKVAHDLYLPGRSCFQLIIEHFGPKVLGPNGFIDRKVLGKIVFNSNEQLNKLNKLVWPAILEESKNEIRQLHAKGFNIIIMEAAVLLQANWKDECHEIWTCIIPPDEAIKRVKERNALTEAEIKLRIDAQPTNSEQVKEANVVICTLWSHDFTFKQVQRAWNELQNFLHNHQDNECNS